MVGGVLPESLAGDDLGHDGTQHVDGLHQAIMGMVAQQQTVHLMDDALGRYFLQHHLLRPHRLQRLGLQGKSQLRGEAQAPQYAQAVFGEAAVGVAHGPQQPRRQVVSAPEGVEQSPSGVAGQGIHGEVAPAEVLFYRGSEGDGIGVAPIAVAFLGAVGGHLEGAPVAHGGHGTVSRSRAMHGISGCSQDVLGLLPASCGCDVAIVDGASQ